MMLTANDCYWHKNLKCHGCSLHGSLPALKRRRCLSALQQAKPSHQTQKASERPRASLESLVVYEPDMSVAVAGDGGGATESHARVSEQTGQCGGDAAKVMRHVHLEPDVPAQERRAQVSCWAEPAGGQSLPLKYAICRLPSATQPRYVGIKRDLKSGPADLRAFFPPFFKSQRFLSPIPEVSCLFARDGKLNEDQCTPEIYSRYQQLFAKDCANIVDEIQRYPDWTTVQTVEGAGTILGPDMNSLNISTIHAEPSPHLDFTLESSCLQPEEEPLSKLAFSLPRLRNLGKIRGVEESEKAFAVDEEEEGTCFSSKANLCSLNGTSSICSSSTSLNGTYNLSHCQETKGDQSLLETVARNITVGSGVGPMLKEESSTQASANDMCMLHSGSAPTGLNLTVTETSVSGAIVDTKKVKSKNATIDLEPGLVGEVASNLTVNVTNPACWMEDSTQSVGSKNHTFEQRPDLANEQRAGPNLTVHLIKSDINGPKMELTAKRAESQNTAHVLQPSQSDKSADTGPHATNLCIAVETTETSSKSARSKIGTTFELQPGPVGDSVTDWVCADNGGAEEWRGSARQLRKSDSICSQSTDPEDGGSLWSLNSSLDMTTNFLVTSTPLLVTRGFSFATNSGSSDVCKRLSAVDHDAGAANSQVDQVPPDGAKPPTKSLARPGSRSLRSGAKPPFPNPVDRKSLSRPSYKLLHPTLRPSTSRLSLAPAPKMLAAPQVSGATSLLSSALTSIGRKTGGALRNMAPSSTLEVSTRRRHTIAESKLPSSGLQKPQTSARLQASSSTSQLPLRPPVVGTSKLQTQKPAATSSRPLGLRDPKGKCVQLPTSSQKQPRGNTDESLPISKKKKVDAPGQSSNIEALAGSAGSLEHLRRPGTRLRAPQSKIIILGDSRITAGALTTKNSDSTAPPPPSAQPAPAPDAPPSAVRKACEDGPQLTNGSAGPQVTDCKSCEWYRQENERLRAELRERDQTSS
ncbi:hypothetical protein AAFF_G00288420 [Aldrovandia affinis]|uniref:Uncharacterized protein n=1 Tax=Aldrovandia affinis TaxID=143900 RepID=A0AAD7SSU0_9TELE|nr:hypothetical protein AAFF_G00288420 [Aldrovandia affinis]